jgi:hypothetical protein
MKVGDLVSLSDDSSDPTGIVIELTMRLYTPSANILIKGEVMEFDTEELWEFHESR